MPIKINILENGTGIEFISSGVITGKEIIEANKKIYTPEQLSILKYKIVDRTTCVEYLVTPEEIQDIVKQDYQASKINKDVTTIMVSPTKLQYGMTRMWQILSEEVPWKSEIFENREDANDFIDKTFKKF